MKMIIGMMIIVAMCYILANEITMLVINRRNNGSLFESFESLSTEWANGSRVRKVLYDLYIMLYGSVMMIPALITRGKEN